MTINADHAWLLDLKPGQKVAVETQGAFGKRSIYAVERVTATQIVIGSWKFKRDTGGPFRGLGGPRLLRLTPEVEASIRRDQLCSYIAAQAPTRLRKAALPLELLENVYTALKNVQL